MGQSTEVTPVATVVYTPESFSPIEEIWQMSREALITDPLSLELGIDYRRISPNPEAFAFIGGQKGDEAKGTWAYRVAHARDSGVALRGGGGAGAGHVFKEEGAADEITHRLLPTAVDDGWVKVVGRQVLGVPEILIKEIDQLAAHGHDNSPAKVMIDGETFLAWDAHKARDRAEEQQRARNGQKVGTTQSGVGPAAGDYAARVGMKFGMLLLPPHELKARVQEEVERNNGILNALGSDVEYDADEIYHRMQEWADRLAPYIRNTYPVVIDGLNNGAFIYEGAQAFGLGRNTGAPGSVTSTDSGMGGLSLNYRTSESRVGHRVGVMKLVPTQVGVHATQSPLPDDVADMLYGRTASRGLAEAGAVSGRKRDYYWLSIPELRAAVETYGLTELVISKVDAADVLSYIDLGMEYVFPDGTVTTNYDPSDPRMKDPATRMNTLRLPGWNSSTAGMTDLHDAPHELLATLATISKLVGVPVVAIGTGPGYNEFAARDGSALALRRQK